MYTYRKFLFWQAQKGQCFKSSQEKSLPRFTEEGHIYIQFWSYKKRIVFKHLLNAQLFPLEYHL